MKIKLSLLFFFCALIFSSCSKDAYVFNTTGQSVGSYHESGKNVLPANQVNTTEEPVLEASLESAPVITENPIIAAEKTSTVTNIKNLYSSDISDLKTFRKEYKKVKHEFRVNNNLIKKDTKNIDAAKEGGGGLSIASFVIGLIGLAIAAMICGILAIIFGAIGLTKGKFKGFAIAGLILGIIDVIAFLTFVS